MKLHNGAVKADEIAAHRLALQKRREDMIAAIEQECSLRNAENPKVLADLVVEIVTDTMDDLLSWDEEGALDFLRGRFENL
jgi:hypothetical protein